MEKLRESIEKYCREEQNKLINDKGINTYEARSKAIQYPGYLIRFTIGGFVITFHLIISIAIIPRLILQYFSGLKMDLRIDHTNYDFICITMAYCTRK